jgi:farnesyl-diphosphate farnesyltransferase
MNEQPVLEREILKGVSRSFYLSLRLLPAAMRRPAAFAYLLARASDTIADSATIPAAQRLQILQSYAQQVAGIAPAEHFSQTLIDSTPDPREKHLLECHPAILSELRKLDPSSVVLIREVLEIILSGQRLDLERFGNSSAENISALPDAAALDDYTWRVAGSVGVFWTKLGFATLGENFSKQSSHEMERLGREYGSALQLVNLLRDVTHDLKAGRCYLPVKDPLKNSQLLEEWEHWRKIALLRLEAGFEYAAQLKSRRLRMASVLPARIAREMLILMEGASKAQLEQGIRISRARVYGHILCEWFSV